MDILSLYLYPEFRLGHRELLLEISRQWDNFDVALVICPTGSGKTVLKQTLAQWAGDCSILVPTNALLEQELKTYPNTAKILRKDMYPVTNEGIEEYARDQELVRKHGFPILSNYQMLLARHIRRRFMLLDEGHKMISFNRELQQKRLWKKDLGFTEGTLSREVLEKYITDPAILDKLKTNDYMIKREKLLYRGRWEDGITLIPLFPKLHPSLEKGVKKHILFSATLNELDIYDMGMAKDKRILKLELPSPIPIERRPVIRDYIKQGISYATLESTAIEIADKIKEIARVHEDSAGLVHSTYAQLSYLRKHLTGSRYLFHRQGEEGAEILTDWLNNPRGRIYIGAGLSEGLDLLGPQFAWQVIAKINWPSLADAAVKRKMEEVPGWYLWQTLRDTIQACGRVSRAPDDFGVTYILDRSFERLVEDAERLNLVPTFFKEAIVPVTLSTTQLINVTSSGLRILKRP